MARKANYFKIGLFFITAVMILFTAIVIWAGGYLTKKTIFFETYFKDSVSGLYIGAPVEFNGVKIGEVEEIEFSGSVYDVEEFRGSGLRYGHYVRVLCSIDKKESAERSGKMTKLQRAERIKRLGDEGLRLQLSSNLLTNQAFLEGTFLDPKEYPVLEFPWEPEHMYVPSAPGVFSTIKDSIDNIISKIEEIDFKSMTLEARELFTEVADTSETLRGFLGELGHTNKQMRGLFDEVGQTNQKVSTLLTNPDPDAKDSTIPETVTSLKYALDEIGRKIKTQGPEIERIIKNARAVLDDVEELTGVVKDHPSELIFSKPPARSELIR